MTQRILFVKIFDESMRRVDIEAAFADNPAQVFRDRKFMRIIESTPTVNLRAAARWFFLNFNGFSTAMGAEGVMV